MQLQLEKTLDVEMIERELTELWKQTSGDTRPEDDFAVLRSRVANLLVYLGQESDLSELSGIVSELTQMHPSRVLLLQAAKNEPDRDIEISIETFCDADKRSGRKRLCCEEVTLKASGSFVSELPSAALPLLVPDLTSFLWWKDSLATKPDEVFDVLLRASDRLIVDSAEFADPSTELIALTTLFINQDYAHVGISDLNWARLTAWRALLAGFYDVPAYRALLDGVDTVRIDYLAPEPARTVVAPQALLFAGWLASRLGWNLSGDQAPRRINETFVFNFSKKEGVEERQIVLELNRVERDAGKPGRLVQVVLESGSQQPAAFTVARSADNLHLVTEALVKEDVHRGRVVPVRNRSAAQLLGREMEILCNDQIYQEALAVAAVMIDHSRAPSGQ